MALGAFSSGCASSGKCDGSGACCEGEGAACCKEGGECKDAEKAKHAEPAAQSSAPINKECPIGGHDVDPNLTVAYQGKTIAFCCDDCKQEFLGMDEKGKSEILAKASAH